MINTSVKKVLHSCTRQISLSACCNSIQKRPTHLELDSREYDPIPSNVGPAIKKKLDEPFSEVKEDTWFTAILRSLEIKRPDGPPKQLTWNKDTLNWDNIMRMSRLHKRDYNIFQQRFVPQRHQQLGNEIAAAHFLVFRGGAVKFYENDQWVRMAKGDQVDDYDKNLPKKFNPLMYVECIDASNVELYFEGLENISNLARLKSLSVRNSIHFDDWCLDKIANEYSQTVEYLDISDCHKVTYRGLSALCKMTRLSTLVVENISDSYEFQLSCVMLQEAMPNLQIQGVAYMDLSITDNVDISSKGINNEEPTVAKKLENVSL